MGFLAMQALRCRSGLATLLEAILRAIKQAEFAPAQDATGFKNSQQVQQSELFLGTQQSRVWFDTEGVSLYSTKTCRTEACICCPAGKGFYGPFTHTRDLYVLLSGRCRESASNGLVPEHKVSEYPRPTPLRSVVGLCFLTVSSLD